MIMLIGLTVNHDHQPKLDPQCYLAIIFPQSPLRKVFYTFSFDFKRQHIFHHLILIISLKKQKQSKENFQYPITTSNPPTYTPLCTHILSTFSFLRMNKPWFPAKANFFRYPIHSQVSVCPHSSHFYFFLKIPNSTQTCCSFSILNKTTIPFLLRLPPHFFHILSYTHSN